MNFDPPTSQAKKNTKSRLSSLDAHIQYEFAQSVTVDDHAQRLTRTEEGHPAFSNQHAVGCAPSLS